MSGEDGPDYKRAKLSDDSAESQSSKLSRFMDWAQKNDITLNKKVKAASSGVAAHCGLVTLEGISKGETVFTIPRIMALTPSTSGISEQLTKEEEKLNSVSGWVPTILAIMYERSTATSPWKPYLDAFPNFEGIELPMFWPRDVLEKEFAGTGMVQRVDNDFKLMKEEFEDIALPFIKRNKALFSFTDDITGRDDDADDSESEDGPPPDTVMVPMADLLNHVSNHNVELKMGEQTLRMIAIRNISEGEEIFNTYGKHTVSSLLQMYGFAESLEVNSHDTIEIPHSLIKSVCEEINWPLRDKAWPIIEKKYGVGEDCVFLDETGYVGLNGLEILVIRDVDELDAKLKVCEQQAEDKDGWVSDDEETLYTKDKLPKELKALLDRVVRKMLDSLLAADLSHNLQISRQQKFAQILRACHRSILTKSLNS